MWLALDTSGITSNVAVGTACRPDRYCGNIRTRLIYRTADRVGYGESNGICVTDPARWSEYYARADV